jgi:predicted porin
VDFVGGKTYDGASSGPLSSAQLIAANAAGISNGNGLVSITASDNTVFQVAGRYEIGPWKFFLAYEHIDYANPNNPLAPGAFVTGGFIAGAVNNSNYMTDKILQTTWGGIRYSITNALDVTGAFYHESQNSYMNSANPTGSCTTTVASSCSGTLDAISLVTDWRFARHMDMYAGVMWSEVRNGMASGYLSLQPGSNKTSSYDPGIGLRYQF